VYCNSNVLNYNIYIGEVCMAFHSSTTARLYHTQCLSECYEDTTRCFVYPLVYIEERSSHDRRRRWLVGWLVDIFFPRSQLDSFAECCLTVTANLQADSEADFFCKEIPFNIRSIFHCSRVQ